MMNEFREKLNWRLTLSHNYNDIWQCGWMAVDQCHVAQTVL